MRNLARRLIAAEMRPKDSSDSEALAAFRVCDKLRVSLSALVGVRGFRTLLARALTLAKGEVRWLADLELGADGSFVNPAAGINEAESGEAAKGGRAVVAHLLKLLATLIGEALTRRLVQQTWPQAVFDGPNSGGKT